jgi:hypothetical protein
MKKTIIATCLLLNIFTSCKKDEPSTSTTTPAVNTIEFNLNGTKVVNGFAFASNGKGITTGDYILSVGSNALSSSILVRVFDTIPITTKTYKVSQTGYNNVYVFYGPYQTRTTTAGYGYITVSSLTATNVKGTFVDSVYQYSTNTYKRLEAGTFNVNF